MDTKFQSQNILGVQFFWMGFFCLGLLMSKCINMSFGLGKYIDMTFGYGRLSPAKIHVILIPALVLHLMSHYMLRALA